MPILGDLEIPVHLTFISLDSGRTPEYLVKTHADPQESMQTPLRKALPQPGVEKTRPCCCEATALTYFATLVLMQRETPGKTERTESCNCGDVERGTRVLMGKQTGRLTFPYMSCLDCWREHNVSFCVFYPIHLNLNNPLKQSYKR